MKSYLKEVSKSQSNANDKRDPIHDPVLWSWLQTPLTLLWVAEEGSAPSRYE